MKAEICNDRLLIYPETPTEMMAMTAFCALYRNAVKKPKILTMNGLVKSLTDETISETEKDKEKCNYEKSKIV